MEDVYKKVAEDDDGLIKQHRTAITSDPEADLDIVGCGVE